MSDHHDKKRSKRPSFGLQVSFFKYFLVIPFTASSSKTTAKNRTRTITLINICFIYLLSYDNHLDYLNNHDDDPDESMTTTTHQHDNTTLTSTNPKPLNVSNLNMIFLCVFFLLSFFVTLVYSRLKKGNGLG